MTKFNSMGSAIIQYFFSTHTFKYTFMLKFSQFFQYFLDLWMQLYFFHIRDSINTIYKPFA